jgi:CubicO group peptidase (beta-lactamase class C family)
MVFKLASITKQFTAIAILQLVEQGKISLQDSVQKFIPDFPPKGYTIP